jgi:hypothetical protein
MINTQNCPPRVDKGGRLCLLLFCCLFESNGSSNAEKYLSVMKGTASQGRSTSRSPLFYLHAATLLTRISCKWKETASQSTRSHLMSTSSDLPTDDHASAKEDAILMVQTHPQEITRCQEEG